MICLFKYREDVTEQWGWWPYRSIGRQ